MSAPDPVAAPPMLMRFGKHKGQPVEDLPTGYIEWVLENCRQLSPTLQKELEAQLVARQGGGIVRRQGNP